MCRGVSGVSETGLLAGLGIWPMRSDLEWKRTYHSRKEKGSVENVLGRYLLNSCLLGQTQNRVVETVVQEVMERVESPPTLCNSWGWVEVKARAQFGAGGTTQDSPGRREPNYSDHHCCLPGSTLAGDWSQEPELGIKHRYLGVEHLHLNC